MSEVTEAENQQNKLFLTETSPIVGERTKCLLASDDRLARIKPIRIMEHLVPGSDSGLILLPGAFDSKTDESSMRVAEELGISSFHIKYPRDTSFSIRREVAEILDHTKARGISNFYLITGSWGGIPATMAIGDILREGTSQIKLFLAVAPALQITDAGDQMRPLINTLGKVMLSVKLPIPQRDMAARGSIAIPSPDFDQSLLDKVNSVPAVFILPPGGFDWWADSRDSRTKYFPNAAEIWHPGYRGILQKLTTFKGHDARYAVDGIRQLVRDLLKMPKTLPQLPEGFKLVKSGYLEEGLS